MSHVELTQLQWAGRNLKRVGSVTIETQDIVARAQTDRYSVLYVSSGEKILVHETLEEIERLSLFNQTQKEVVKRFKRDMRECKATGMPVDQAFAAVWEEAAIHVKLPESEQAALYQELLD